MAETAGESRRHRYLRAMQVDVWLTGGPGPPAPEAIAAGEADSTETVVPSVTDDRDAAAIAAGRALAELEAVVSGCRRCELHHGRTQTVFGTGDVRARCMIIGEAPGAEEDARGEPFVGRAGQLLNAMLRAIGMSREGVYISNIIKCRPPKNRDPKSEEMVAASPSSSVTMALAPPPKVGAVMVPLSLMTNTSLCP